MPCLAKIARAATFKKSALSNLLLWIQTLTLEIIDGELRFANVFGDRSSFAVFYLETHLVAFFQTLETGHIYGGVVNKYIRALFLFDETISFLVAKPFNCSVGQNSFPLLKNSYITKSPD